MWMGLVEVEVVTFVSDFRNESVASSRSTQRAVLQKSCSTVGILLGNLTHFDVVLAK